MKVESIHLPSIVDPCLGLPDKVFDYVSAIMPMFNVDLLVYKSEDEFILTRRKNDHFSPGWHVPGSILRFKEPLSERLSKLKENELCNVKTTLPKLICAYEIILRSERQTRGHFISFLYKAFVKEHCDSAFMQKISGKFFSKCPKDIIPVHNIYKNFMNNQKPSDSVRGIFGNAQLINTSI